MSTSIRNCSPRAFLRHAGLVLQPYSSSSTSSSLSSTTSPTSSRQHRPGQEGRESVTFVVGNEGADLDSMTSALVYAYVNTQFPSGNSSHDTGHHRRTDQPCTEGRAQPVYIPLLNIPRADIRLRPEFKPVLARAGIEPGELLTVEDISVVNSHASAVRNEEGGGRDVEGGVREEKSEKNDKDKGEGKGIDVVLVDGNVARGPLQELRLQKRVVGVVDHHELEGDVRQRADRMEPWLVERVGSCTSLVVELWRQRVSRDGEGLDTVDTKGSEGGENRVQKQWDAELAAVAIASILVDTRCLSNEGGKTTEDDRRAVEFLEQKIRDGYDAAGGDTSGKYDRKKYFEEISAAKQDVESLQVEEILRKDYKQWAEKRLLGISSVVKPVRFLGAKAFAEDSCEGNPEDKITENAEEEYLQPFLAKCGGFAKERSLSLYAVMTAFTPEKGGFRRELLLVVPVGTEDKSGLNVREVDDFVKVNVEDLGLSISSGDWRSVTMDGDWKFAWRFWRQMSVEKSRKQVAPLLRKLVSR